MRENARNVSPEEQELQRSYALRIKAMSHRPQSYHVVTFGCQMNAHDSEILSGMLQSMGMTEAPTREEADLVLFNTCCVRDNAERRALGNVNWLKELKRDKPELIIGVCGCMIQQPGMAEKILKQNKFIDLAFGTTNTYKLPQLLHEQLLQARPVVWVDTEELIAEGLPVKRLRGDHAYITIMYGCDNFCSYCIVPYVRGRERSREPEAILAEARELYASGVKEIMLLGQNVNSFGKGLTKGVTFPELLRQLDDVGIPRIRFMTSHPKDLSDELIEVMRNSRHICPQFHLPVQSGSDEILTRMNRHYDRAAYLDRVERLRAAVPGISITTDVIVGFPGETEEQFSDTLSLVEQVGYDSAFTFIYSPRQGTKAAAMAEQIAPDVAQNRFQRLLALQDRRQEEVLGRFVGQEAEVLVESLSRRSSSAVSGKSRHGVSVTFPGDASDVGRLVRVKITELAYHTLRGARLDDPKEN